MKLLQVRVSNFNFAKVISYTYFLQSPVKKSYWMSVCHVEHMQMYTVMIVDLHGVKCVMISGISIPRESIIKQEYVLTEIFNYKIHIFSLYSYRY